MSTERTEAVILEATEAFVRDYCAHELGLLDLLWDQFVELRRSPEEDRPHDRLVHFGLSFAAQQRARLVSPMVLLVVASVIDELGPGCQFTLEHIKDAVRESAKRLGASKRLARSICAHLPEKLHAALQGSLTFVASWSGATQVAMNDAATIVFGAELINGTSRLLGPTPYAELIDLASATTYDLLVDECAHQVSRPGSAAIDFRDVSREQRAMLWLILTRPGGEITFREIAILFDVPENDPVRIYRPKVMLMQLLGRTLRDKVIGPGHETKRYSVPRHGWCSLWIRFYQDVDRSDLITFQRERGRIAQLRQI